MNDRTTKFAFWVACIVAPLAVVGSAFSLYRIAEGAALALPLALPVALDLTALAAAAQIRARRHLVLGWLTLIGGVAISAALQVADAWARGPSAWLVHGSLPLAALLCFELAMPGKAPAGDNEEPTDTLPGPPAGATEPGPPVSPKRARTSSPKPTTMPALIRKAERLAERNGVSPEQLSQRQLMSLGIGTAKARDLAAALKPAGVNRLTVDPAPSPNGSEPELVS